MMDDNISTLLGASILLYIVDGLGDPIQDLVGPRMIWAHPIIFLFVWLPFYVVKIGVTLTIGSSFLNIFFGRHIRMTMAAAQARRRASMKNNTTKKSPTKNSFTTKTIIATTTTPKNTLPTKTNTTAATTAKNTSPTNNTTTNLQKKD